MYRIFIIAVASLALTSAARAQDAKPDADPVLLKVALNAAVEQRNKAQNEGVQMAVNFAMAQREIDRLRKELEQAKKPTLAEPAK